MPALSSAVATARARLGGLARCDVPDTDPRYDEARRELRAAVLAEHVERVVNGWPKLTPCQLDSIAALLRAGAR